MRAIADVYRKTVPAPDRFWNKYVCRPAAAVVVCALAPTRITPNQITLCAFVVALGSAALIALWPGYWGLLLGVIAFELSYVLDCADGMLARLRGIQSRAGHLFDFLMDELKAFVILAVVAVRLYLGSGNVRFLLLGIGGLVCLASGIAMTTFMRRPEIAGPAARAGASPPSTSLLKRAVRTGERLGQFLIHYPSYILYVAIAGRIELFLYVYIAVNALYVLRSLAVLTLRFGRSAWQPPAES
jgi:phosphatidylglycerophosphate synthase